MSDTAVKITPFVRQEYTRDVHVPASIGEVERALPLAERIWNEPWARRVFILILLGLLWQGYSSCPNMLTDLVSMVWNRNFSGIPACSPNPLLFPTLTDTMVAWWDGIVSGVIPARLGVTLRMLLIGYSIGLGLAAVFVTFAVSTRFGTDLLSTLTSMFNPLPAIALLPLALLWFGLGAPSIIFVIVSSVLWAVALNTHAGCMAVSETLRMAGQTFGLKGFRYVLKILMPAAFPAILSGLKIGWAFAWRTLIAAELVFGVSSGSGGLGWYIFENRNMLDTANVFAGLLTVMAVGLLVEGVIFRTIETKTIRRWGMQHG
jgi:NitT/TauT family transport system permease protein